MLPLLALAFAISRWPEARKAALWAGLRDRRSLDLLPSESRDLAQLEQRLPELRAEARALGAQLVLPGDDGSAHLWPALPYPVALWVRGSLPPVSGLALVGSREASRSGLERARRLGRELTQAGIPVLSGLARGIDGAAHEGALEAGPTWGVMGSGLAHPYPPEHQALMDRMVAAGGGVITPFAPQALPRPWHFPRRNLLLAAWTAGVVVIQGRTRSGSLLTARLALDLGREVWAMPGDPLDPLAEGPNGLLREGGARMIRGAADLLEDLGYPLVGLSEGPMAESHA